MTINLRKRAFLSAFAALILVVHLDAAAVIITPSETSLTVVTGDMPSLDLDVQDLGNFAPPSLGAFDLDVVFDSSLLSFAGATFTTLLGDEFFFESFTSTDDTTPGLLELSQVSFLSPGELDALQPSSFNLVSIQFDAIGDGTSPISLQNVDLSDADGNTIPEGSIPEPSTWLLLGGGCALMAWRRRKS